MGDLLTRWKTLIGTSPEESRALLLLDDLDYPNGLLKQLASELPDTDQPTVLAGDDLARRFQLCLC